MQQLSNAFPHLSLGCPVLDAIFHGGLHAGSITEFVGKMIISMPQPMAINQLHVIGEPGAGKTQLALQAAASVTRYCQPSGNPSSQSSDGSVVIWLYTEGPPPVRRLQQLVDGTRARFPNGSCDLDNVAVMQGVGDTPQAILHAVEQVRVMCQIQRDHGAKLVRLLIIDSVAWVFRDVGREVGGRVGEGARSGEGIQAPRVEEASYRASLIFKLAGELKRLAADFCLAVLVINQVMDFVEDDRETPASSIQAPRQRSQNNKFVSCGRRVVPSLGLSWSNCVNHRIFLSKEFCPEEENGHQQSGTYKRSLRVVFSPSLPPTGCELLVLPDRVVGREG